MGDRLIIAARALTMADTLERATRMLDEAINAAAHRGAVFDLRFLMLFRSDAAYRRGAVFDAEADARTGYDWALENEWLIGVPASVAYLVIALIERAELDEAARVVDEAGLGGPAAALPDHYTNHLLLHARGRLRIAAGSLEEGLADLLECGRRQTALGEPNPSLIPWRSDAALALRQTGESGEARRLCAEELELARAFGAPRAIGMALRAAGVVEGGPRGLELVRARRWICSRAHPLAWSMPAHSPISVRCSSETGAAQPPAKSSARRWSSPTAAAPARWRSGCWAPCARRARARDVPC